MAIVTLAIFGVVLTSHLCAAPWLHVYNEICRAPGLQDLVPIFWQRCGTEALFILSWRLHTPVSPVALVHELTRALTGRPGSRKETSATPQGVSAWPSRTGSQSPCAVAS